MAKTLTLKERLSDRLKKLGLTTRKANELAKGLASTASRQPVKGTVTGKLTAKLIKLGLTERKAKELAQGIAPTVRAAIKSKAKKAQIALTDVDDALVEKTVAESVDAAEDPELDKVAPRVNGHRVRLDLDVVSVHGKKGIEILRVMDGLTSTATYLVAAVRKDEGILAIRELGSNLYRVKFYPTMAYWDRTQEALRADFGAHEYVERDWYQRLMFSREGVERLLDVIHNEDKPTIKKLLDRFLSVTARPLFKAFDYLYKRKSVAA